ncbi:MAG: HAD family hydrolase [Phormidesmis sp.]
MPSTSLPPPILTALSQSAFSDIRLLATDMDGTLTTAGNFTPALLQAFEALGAAGIDVMIVTGRSAGWVSGLVNYLPVVGAIAENGGLYISKSDPQPLILPDIPKLSSHRDRLSSLFERLRVRRPQLKPALDNAYRITDWTFDIDGLLRADFDQMQEICAALHFGFTYSTVQCHLKLDRQNKAAGLRKVLAQQFPDLTMANVVTVGDSPNDESLFDPAQFPCSVGVANIAHYLPALAHAPAYVTPSSEGAGFIELVEKILGAIA